MDINWHAIEKTILSEHKIHSGLKAEELRSQIDPEPILKSLLSLVHEADKVSIEDLPRLKFKSEIMFGILKKVMPDLRPIEIGDKNRKHSTLIIQMESSVIGED